MSTNNDNIFASPVEPLFNNEYHGMTSAMLQDWLVTIAKINNHDIKTSKETQYYFSTGSWCECIFMLCERYSLPWPAKFAALDLLDRFMVRHVQGLFKYVQNSTSTTKKEDWTSILERITKQAFFRMVTCCQIASKLNSHYKVITVKRVRRCLLDAGYSYTIDSILQSEMRVLKTLEYNVTKCTAVDFVEIILEILGRNCTEEVNNIKAYHELAVKILTLVYINQDKIYDALYLTVAKPQLGHLTSLEEKRKLVAVKSDKMLLAVSVIAVTVYIINQPHTTKVMRNLNLISEVPLEDIDDFVRVILRHIKGNDHRASIKRLNQRSTHRSHQRSRSSTAQSMEF